MTTAYPAGLDSFSNPSATTARNSPTLGHAKQHSDNNDAIEALQAELGLTPSSGQATVKARLDTFRVDIRDFTPDPSNATAAIVAAIAQAETAGVGFRPYISAGTWIVPGSGTSLFSTTKSLVFDGDGANRSIIKVASTVGATTRAFRFAPATSAEAYFFGFRNIAIQNESGNPGLHLIDIDVTTSTSLSFAAKLVIEDCWLGYPGWTLAGHAIHVTNGTLKNPAVFCSTISRNQIYGGMYLVGVSDSIDVDSNTITGTGQVEFESTAGAAKFTFTKNNVTCAGGLWVKASVNPTISQNYFEATSGATGHNGAYVDIDVSTAPRVLDNQMSVLTGVALNGIRIGTTTDAIVDGNSLSMVDVGSTGIVYTSTATGPVHGDNPLIGGAGPAFSNASTSLRLKGSAFRHVNLVDGTPITNTAVETAHDQAFTIKANTFKVGDIVRMRTSGIFSTDAAGTVVITQRARAGGIGGSIYGAAGVTVTAGVTSGTWSFEAGFIVRTIGSGGTIRSLGGVYGWQGLSGSSLTSTGTSTLALNTTIDNSICLTTLFASARSGDSITLGSILVEVNGSGS